ncbi:hypothetical protein Efla_006778 [Eimeria flavescens]
MENTPQTESFLFERLSLFPPDISSLCTTSGGGGQLKGNAEDEKTKQADGEEQEKLLKNAVGKERSRFLCVCGLKTPLLQKEELKGAVWQRVMGVQNFIVQGRLPPDLYYRLSRGASPPSAVLSLIARDALFKVLKAYAAFNPEVGYCQGMGFVCGVLLLHLEEAETFFFLVCLLHKFSLSELFRPGLPLLDKYFFQFQQLLHLHMPALSLHLRAEGVEPSMYLSGWLLTLFAYSLSLECVARVWDVFFRDGEKMLFRTALAILRIHQEELMGGSLESILDALKAKPAKLSPSKLMETALQFKVRRSTLARLEAEYAEMRAAGQTTPRGKAEERRNEHERTAAHMFQGCGNAPSEVILFLIFLPCDGRAGPPNLSS